MNSEVAKQAATEVDGFEGYEDAAEGTQERGGQVIQGQRLKFTNEATWETDDGEEIDENREFIAVDVARIVQRWQDQKPAETIILAPHQKFPDVAKLNADVPREEWVEGPDGNPRGPWQAQHIVYLLDPATMDRFSFPTGTIGGAIAVRDLTDKVKWMRRFRGQSVLAVVSLRDVFMHTKFGGRQRPRFEVRRWVRFGGEGEPLAVTGPTLVVDPPNKATVALDDFAKPTKTPPEQESGVQTVDSTVGEGSHRRRNSILMRLQLDAAFKGKAASGCDPLNSGGVSCLQFFGISRRARRSRSRPPARGAMPLIRQRKFCASLRGR